MSKSIFKESMLCFIAAGHVSTHIYIKRSYIIFTFAMQRNILRTISSMQFYQPIYVQSNFVVTSCTPVKSYRYDQLLRRGIEGLIIRRQCSSTSSSNNSDQRGISDKNIHLKSSVPSVVKGMNLKQNINREIDFISVRTRKSKITDSTTNYTENNFITALRAMNEYILKPS